MFAIIYIVVGIITVSVIAYLIIRFCFETNVYSTHPQMRLRRNRDRNASLNRNVTCPVSIVIHSCSSNGNIEEDYDLPPTYTKSVNNSRSNSISSLPDYNQAVATRITANPLSDRCD